MRAFPLSRRVASTAVASFGLLSAAASAQAGVVVYYPFNNGANPAVANDASGNGNTGTVTGAVYTAAGNGSPVDGGTGRALSFDGSGDFVRPLNEATAFDVLQTANKATIAFWIFGDAAAQPRGQTNFTGLDGSNVRQVQGHVPWSDGTIYWDTGGCCVAGQHRIFKAATAGDYEGDWDHWVFVKDGGNSAIYVNNALFHSGATTAAIGNIQTFWVGSGNNTESYLGLMDDFIVLDEALPATGARSVNTLFTQGGAALVPEPTAAAGLALGAAALFSRRRRRTA